MSLTSKKLLIFTLSITILVILVLYDPRSSIIAEPFNLTKAALSIAISYLFYGVEGFVGLHEVYEVLNEIPSISNYTSRYYAHLGGHILDFENINEIKEYGKIISQTITETKNLNIINKENVHTYNENDIGYVLYIIISFLIFGINLKSISILFLSILIFSSVVFMFNFHKNNVCFFLLQTFLFAVIIVIIGNYGGSIQITSINNQRFLSILSVIPALHLSLIFLNKNQPSFKSLLSAAIQFLILIFLCHVRGTAMWAVIFLILFCFLWIFINISKLSKKNIFVMLSSIVLFFLIFNLSGEIIKKNLAPEHKNKSVITKHMFWHSLFVGMALNPKIHENYVCSDIVYDDLWEIENIPCGVYTKKYPGKSEFYKNVFYRQPLDVFATHAVLKYLNEEGLGEQLGIINKNNLSWSLNWPRYEGILKKLYFTILINNPLEFLYMHLIIKPLKFILELVKFIFYFFNSFNINFIFIFLIFISSIFVQYFAIVKIKIERELTDIKNFNKIYLIESIFLLMLLASIMPSIIFYPSPQSAVQEFIIILISFLIFYLKKNIEKRSESKSS